ncbi:hypothetical protein [Streptomyces angustmyceticus]|uniref:hypothetical protein n=1 Tax=Streptomyces angustmyceticus TaxID=285578 RepID=UPI00344CB3AA
MSDTADIRSYMARIITERGFHTGPNFVGPDGAVSIGAAAFLAAHGWEPDSFRTDEDLSVILISCSAPAMQAIKAISADLDTEPSFIRITEDHDVPDYIEHVERWASTPQFRDEQPPRIDQVIGRIVRTNDTPRALAA